MYSVETFSFPSMSTKLAQAAWRFDGETLNCGDGRSERGVVEDVGRLTGFREPR